MPKRQWRIKICWFSLLYELFFVVNKGAKYNANIILFILYLLLNVDLLMKSTVLYNVIPHYNH